MLRSFASEIVINLFAPRSAWLASGRYRMLGVSLWILASLSGCSTIGRHQEAIRVTVSNIRIEEATLLEQLYTVTLRVQNRSELPIGIRGGSFDLIINDRDFGSGVSNARIEIPAFADAQVEVRLVSTLFGMLRLIKGMQDRTGGSLSYEISGRLAIEGRIGGLSFREQGEFDLERTSRSEQPQPR